MVVKAASFVETFSATSCSSQLPKGQIVLGLSKELPQLKVMAPRCPVPIQEMIVTDR